MAETLPGTTISDPAERSRLIRLAYRLLGSVEEAEDVVQDAQVKLLAMDRAPEEPQAYLFRTVTNLAIDRLRHLKVQRRAYTGPWLPEPMVTEPSGADADVALSEDLSVGFLLLLERLSVSERVAFVLREACDLSFKEISEVLAVNVEACRQRYHRAKRKLDGARRPPAPAVVQRRVLERLIEAVSAGDAPRLASLLTDDALLLTDGGGRVGAAIRPVEDPRRIAQVLVHLSRRDDHEGLELARCQLNGAPGLVMTVPGPDGQRVPFAALLIDVEGDQASHIYIVRNPGKLANLPTAAMAGR